MKTDGERARTRTDGGGLGRTGTDALMGTDGTDGGRKTAALKFRFRRTVLKSRPFSGRKKFATQMKKKTARDGTRRRFPAPFLRPENGGPQALFPTYGPKIATVFRAKKRDRVLAKKLAEKRRPGSIFFAPSSSASSARVRACARVRARAGAWASAARACGHAHVRACGRAGVQACGKALGRWSVRPWARARVRACAHARMRACVRACTCVRARVCARARARARGVGWGGMEWGGVGWGGGGGGGVR